MARGRRNAEQGTQTVRRCALVTGASRGIGRALAKALALEGTHVFALARTQSALASLYDELGQGSKPTLVPLDLRDLDGIERLRGAIEEGFGGLDLLVHAASVFGPSMLVSQLDTKALSDVIGVNALAPQALLKTFDPLLRIAKGKVVMLTRAPQSRPFWSPFEASKALLNQIALTYAQETKAFGVTLALVDPGPTDTALFRSAFPGQVRHRPPSPEARAKALLALINDPSAPGGQIVQLETSAQQRIARPANPALDEEPGAAQRESA